MNAVAQEQEEISLEDNDLVRQAIRQAMEKMQQIDLERDCLNKRAEEVRANLEASHGISRKGFAAAYSRFKLDEAKRNAHDHSFALCCNAMNIGYQPSLRDQVED